ncbi:MAG: hypothetical protein WCG31_03395 [Deltaproteobacteria bacterium]
MKSGLIPTPLCRSLIALSRFGTAAEICQPTSANANRSAGLAARRYWSWRPSSTNVTTSEGARAICTASRKIATPSEIPRSQTPAKCPGISEAVATPATTKNQSRTVNSRGSGKGLLGGTLMVLFLSAQTSKIEL